MSEPLYPLGRGCCGAPDATACHQRGLCWMQGVHPESPGYVVHACPEADSGVTGCCGQTPFELDPRSRMTVNPTLVTCDQPDPDTTQCALHPLGMPPCRRPAIYEMDIDRDEKWIPLCAEHGPRYRASSNIRVRTRKGGPR